MSRKKEREKLKEMAKMFYDAQPIKIQSPRQIYRYLKTINKNKDEKKEPETETDSRTSSKT